jgi:FkbM family methyltransferase
MCAFTHGEADCSLWRMVFLKKLSHQVHNLRQIARHPLNAGHEASSIVRWLRWHISSRLALGPVVVPFINSSTLTVETGMASATGNIFWGLSEPEEMGFCLHLLRPGDVFLDVGANVGVFTILALAAGANAIAVEPGSAAFAALERNVRSNGYLDRVDFRKVAVSDHIGHAKFSYCGASPTNHLIVDEEPNSIEVPLTTLDAIVDGRPIVLLKIDIEGFELPALRGATSVLSNKDLKAVIVEVDRGPDDKIFYSSDLLQLVNSAGFQPASYDPYARQLKPANERMTNNLIFVRDFASVQRTVTDAPRFSLSGGRSSI